MSPPVALNLSEAVGSFMLHGGLLLTLTDISISVPFFLPGIIIAADTH
jgi:hypothetical protein